MVIDAGLVRELLLYAENDSELYQTEITWIKNFRRKMKSGRYNTQLAIKGIAENYVPQVITKYNKEIARLPRVSREDKYAFATQWVAYFEQENKFGNYDNMN